VYITTERTCEHKGSALLICQLSKTRLQRLRSLEKFSAGAIIMYSVDGIWNNCVGPFRRLEVAASHHHTATYKFGQLQKLQLLWTHLF